MAEHNTAIEWTHIPGFKGETWNPIVGCDVVSPGCTNCYAMKVAGARLDGNPATPHYAGTTAASKAGPVWTGKVARAADRTRTAPLRWTKPRAVFVNSMGDLFHEAIADEWIDEVFAVMALCPQHIFIILTKRPERMRDYLSRSPDQLEKKWGWHAAATMSFVRGDRDAGTAEAIKRRPAGIPLPNVWLGVSAEDQARADQRVPVLLDTPAAVRFVSCEPLLGTVDLTRLPRERRKGYGPGHLDALRGWTRADGHGYREFDAPARLDWVIAGGESGKAARPMHSDWVRGLRDQCAAADVPFFFKQWGEWLSCCQFGLAIEIGDDPEQSRFWHREYNDGAWSDPFKPMWMYWEEVSTHDVAIRLGKKAAGRTLDELEHSAFPACVTAEAQS